MEQWCGQWDRILGENCEFIHVHPGLGGLQKEVCPWNFKQKKTSPERNILFSSKFPFLSDVILSPVKELLVQP